MRYERPHSIEDAVGLLAGSVGTASILAGGSDLLVRMKGGFVEPDLIVDIKAIDGLSEIRETADGFSIGAAVPCALMGESAALTKAWPAVTGIALPALSALYSLCSNDFRLTKPSRISRVKSSRDEAG